MSSDWIANELKTVNLHDQRLNHRFSKILQSLSERPNVSIPAACGGHTETMAAYRFFDNDKITFAKILKPHRDATWIGSATSSRFRSGVEIVRTGDAKK